MRKLLTGIAGLLMIATAALAQESAPPQNIFEAAQQGDLSALEAFIAKNQSIVSLDALGSTPLHHAAAGGHEQVAEFLLDRGADPNLVNNDGFTPLHSCALTGDSATAALLIARGSQIFMRDNLQQTPLNCCALKNNLGVARVLLASGADVNDINENGWTPLRVARYAGHTEFETWLLQNGAVDHEKQ